MCVCLVPQETAPALPPSKGACGHRGPLQSRTWAGDAWRGAGRGGGCRRVKQGSLPGLSLLENLSVAFMPVTKKHFCPKACRFASYGDCRSREGPPGSSATLVVHVGRAVAGPAAPCPGCHHSCPGQLPSWRGAGFRGHEGSCHPAGLVTCHPQRELRPRPQELL